MSSPVNSILTGTFLSDGLLRSISLPSGYNKFEMLNITDIGSAAANTNVMKALGSSSMPAGSAFLSPKTSGAATLGSETMITSGGFTIVPDSSLFANGSPVALTAITAANPSVVSSASTAGLVDSASVVRLVNTTGMLQVGGMDFTVGTIVANTSFQLKYLNATGFAAAATGGSYRIINAQSRYYPRSRFITGITVGSPTVITLSVTHGFTVGQLVRIIVSSDFGMPEINNQIATITAVNTATNSISVNIDSTGFTAFAFPTSGIAGAGVTFAQVVPVGEAATSPYQNLLDDATDNQSFTGVLIGASVQTTGKVYQWIATKGTSI